MVEELWQSKKVLQTSASINTMWDRSIGLPKLYQSLIICRKEVTSLITRIIVTAAANCCLKTRKQLHKVALSYRKPLER